MTFKDVFGRLDAIDREAVSLLEAAGFHPDEGPGETVRPLRDPAENLLESLELLHEELTCLGSPVSREYRLELFPDGRYGFFDRDGTARRLSCGKVIEAKILDRYGRERWTRCRVEHDGSDYYLWGHMDIPLAGLTIREREVRHDF